MTRPVPSAEGLIHESKQYAIDNAESVHPIADRRIEWLATRCAAAEAELADRNLANTQLAEQAQKMYDDREKLRLELAEAREEIRKRGDSGLVAFAFAGFLLDELAEAREDTARLDWLASQSKVLIGYRLHTPTLDLRRDLDAARATGKEEARDR